MIDADPVIEAKDLTRDYKSGRAVDELTLSVSAGELFGLVGPDGAGKTTTLRMLSGLLGLTAGKAAILGFDLSSQSESIKPHVGYMAQQFSLYGELSVLENLMFFADLFDVSTEDIQGRMTDLLAFAGLTEFIDRRAANLSGGMQKKLMLACTLIHEPDILLLDEPTTGVDPISRREFWNILTELHLLNTTILVSTPYMDEADRCSRVGLMYRGRLVECDTPQNIKNRIKGDVIEIQSEDWQSAKDTVKEIDGVREIQMYGKALHILVDDGRKQLRVVERILKKSGIGYQSIRIASIRMEEAFISLINRMEV